MLSFPRFRRALWLLPILGLLAIGLSVQVFAASGAAPPDPTTKFGVAADPARPHASDHVMVRLQPDATPKPDFEHAFGRWYRAPVLPNETPQQALYRLAAMAQIEKVELDYLLQLTPPPSQKSPDRVTELAWGYEPDDPYFPDQWNFYDVLAPEAWKRGWDGSGVVVAVVDTGVWPGPDLDCRSFIEPVSIISGTVTTGMAAVQDDNGHGTHVTGTIGECTDNGFRDAGLANNVVIMPIKVLGADGFGWWSDIAQGIDWARTYGAHIINMSLGAECDDTFPNCSVDFVNDAIDAAVADGLLLIASAGNETNNYVNFPANHPDVLAVGATDIMLDPAPYTNYGPDLFITAPGGNLSEDLNGDGWPDGIEQETRHPGDADWDSWFYEGTSMAAPHVSGAAALLWSAFPTATADDIAAALMNSAMDRGLPGKDDDFGYGFLQIDDAFCQLSGAECTDILLNGDFEGDDGWQFDSSNGVPEPAYSIDQAVTGEWSMYFGMEPPVVTLGEGQPDPDAGILGTEGGGYYHRIYQDIPIPADVDDIFIDFWYMPCTEDSSISRDWQRFWVYDPNDPNNENLRKTYMKVLENDCVWKHLTFKINQNYKGRTLRINFSVHNNSKTNTLTWMYLDRVRLITYTYQPTPTETPTPTPSPTDTPTPTNTPTPTPTPTETPTPPSGAVLRLVTSPASGDIGDTFVTEIYADGITAPGLGAWQAHITYNPAVIAYDSHTFGDALGSTGRTVIPLFNGDTPGEILIGASTLPGPDGVTGDNLLLATITWHAIADGDSPLNLTPEDMQKLLDIDNNAFSPLTLINSHITVGVTPTPVIAAEEVIAEPGEVFDLDVTMANFTSPGIGALTFDVGYDPAVLAPTGCTPDPDSQFDSAVCNESFAPGVVRVSLLSTTGISGDHRLATIEFMAVGNAGDISSIPVDIQTLSDPSGNPLVTAIQDGLVTLEEAFILGDVNCDNQVDTVDAMFIMQYDVGLRTASNQCPPPPDTIFEPACDVSGDAQCNSIDALFIMQCQVGIPNAFCPVSQALDMTPLTMDQSATIMAGKGVVLPHGQISIPVIAKMGDASLGAGTIELGFDPNVVKPTACNEDPDHRFDLAVCNVDYAQDAVRFTLASTAGVGGDLILATITFEPVGEPGESTPLTVAAPTFADPQGNAIAASLNEGRIDIWSRLRVYLPLAR